VIVAAAGPDAALLRWVQSVPAVRCMAPAFRAWIPARDGDAVPRTPVSGEKYERAGFDDPVAHGFTAAGGIPNDVAYALARVPRAHAIVLRAQEQEGLFLALVPEPAAPPPRTIAALAAAPRAHGLGLGSTRADVERALGRGRAKTACGYDVVRYDVQPPAASVAEMWFFYRAGLVAAIARYEAV
jgi:GNAT superfamily N-acetyltransferase